MLVKSYCVFAKEEIKRCCAHTLIRPLVPVSGGTGGAIAVSRIFRVCTSPGATTGYFLSYTSIVELKRNKIGVG